MPIRNPFARTRPAPNQDENVRPGSSSAGQDGKIDVAHPGFERVDTVGSKASASSAALSIRSRKSQDTGEYKMSVVNDSGVYLPPSPVEKEPTWPRRYLARTSTDTRSSAGEIEHFSISRESFDSYRRSFDICAKSPVVVTDTAPRQSLDSSVSRFPRLPRSALGAHRFEREPPTPEEAFEEVGLNDENKPPQQQQPVIKKRGFFSKFGSESTADAPLAGATPQPTTTMSRFLPSRKRGQSGQGAELYPIPDHRPGTADSARPQEQEVQA
ncbi:hypothetical protein QBC46DRAFT_395470 [Diplogelasinospora grovesii]|uniref:Uncharacterized protein n=1 Tax=Diplogelasinospora grovesii TaxID=303347 RepID=A0AAN6MZD7_9PEZI|nr:hypothetical protein QBC46DRAFT_395470 [Diplogelasinospora grovesii]